MKRVLLTAVIAVVVLVPSNASAEGQGPCSGWFSDITHTMPMEKVVDHTQRTIACAVDLWPVDGGLVAALAVAERESHFDPEAYNPSGCAGVYQHMLRYWEGRVDRWWNPNWLWKEPRAFNMRANVIVTMRMVHAEGWGPW